MSLHLTPVSMDVRREGRVAQLILVLSRYGKHASEHIIFIKCGDLKREGAPRSFGLTQGHLVPRHSFAGR